MKNKLKLFFTFMPVISIILFACCSNKSFEPNNADKEAMTASETTPICYPAKISPYIESETKIEASESTGTQTQESGSASPDTCESGGEIDETESSAPITLPQGSRDVQTFPQNPQIRNGPSYSFVAVGDNVVHTGIWLEAKTRAAGRGGREYYFAPVFDEIADIISGADLAFINQETLMGGSELGNSNYPRFNGPQDIGRDLVEIGFDIVNIANNHMADKGVPGLTGTLDFWESQPVTLIGGYRNYADYQKVRTVKINGMTSADSVTIALLSYTYSTNGIPLPKNTELYVPYIDYTEITAQVAAAKKVSDLVFVSIHWGEENTFSPTAQQISLAQYLADIEVDVIIGHHPHVVQPITWLTGKNGYNTLCIYSLGNIVSLMAAPYNMVGGVMTFEIVKSSPGWYIACPVFLPTVFFYGTNYYSQRIYLMRDFTEELASRMGTQNYGYKTNLAQLRGYVTNTIHPAFLPEYMQ